MFGFITAPCVGSTCGAGPIWRGAFCGLARRLAADYSPAARILVNRDGAFLGLLGLALDPRPPVLKTATCCNPLAEPFPVADDHPAIHHAAAITVGGLSAKLADDAQDERLTRRLLARSAAAVTGPLADRALGHLNSSGFPSAEVIEDLARQPELELDDPTQAAQPTARSFARIVSHLGTLFRQPSLQAPLSRLGAAYGELIYWRDAFDDRSSDLKTGSFNPYQYLPAEAIQSRIHNCWHIFQESLAHLPVFRHQLLLRGVEQSTHDRHAAFLSLPTAHATLKSDGELDAERSREGKRTWRSRCRDSNAPCCEDCVCLSCFGLWEAC